MKIQDIRARMQKSFDFFTDELSKVRGGRANPQLIEDVQVEVYGSSMPIKQVGTVTVVDPTLITVSCWDSNNVEAVKKAIEETELNVNPVVDGSTVKVPLPSLSEERREELVKMIKKMGEETRIVIRNNRRDALDEVEKMDGSEDDKERMEKEIQKIVDEFNKKIDDELEKKEEELMNI